MSKPPPDAPRSFDDVLGSRLDSLESQYLDAAAGLQSLTHVPTGIPRLDELGLGELGVLAAAGGHTGDGKSLLRKQLAWGAASAGHGVLEFSFEDPAALAADRLIADAMDVDSMALRRLRLASGPEEIPALIERLRAVRELHSTTARRISWFDAALSTEELFATIERSWRDDTRLVLVDYAQMFDAEGDERSTERVIARLAGRLSRLAQDRWCSVVLFSQVRREVLDRGRRWFENARYEAGRRGSRLGVEAVQGFRPGDGDLQWSSALVQRAKMVPYIFRPGRWCHKLGINHVPDDVMEVYMDKNNWGRDVQVVTLRYEGSRARLS